MPPARTLEQIAREFSQLTCESYVIDTKDKRNLALDAFMKVRRIWQHLKRIKAPEKQCDGVSDLLKKLREKLDMSVPSLGKYTLRVGENVVDKSRLPKVIDADFSQREDQDKEQVVIQKKTRAKPVLHVGSDDPHVMRRVRAKVKGKDVWRCTRCRLRTRSATTCGKLQLQQCLGTATARLRAHVTHRTIDNGVHVYCRLCGVYGDIRGDGLRRPCRGAFAATATKTGAQRARLRQGRHPVTGRLLSS